MGLQISTTKLRRFILGTQGLNDDDASGDTIVHTFQWEPEHIHMHTDEPLLYLGGQWDDNGLSKTELDDTKAMVRAHCAEVGATAASAETKLGSTKLVTYAKARYKGKIATWTLKEQEEIDKIFYAFHTKTTKNMKTFPYDLLYLNKERGGVGLQRFSDAVNIDKLAELLRAYTSERMR